jgi:hypothetical protein
LVCSPQGPEGLSFAGDLLGDLLGAAFGNDTSGRVLLTLFLTNGSNIQTVVTTSLASVTRRVR